MRFGWLRHPRRRALAVVLAVVVALAAGVSIDAALAPPALPPVDGVMFDRAVPDIPLLDAQGRPTSLAALQGKIVVLAPFMTLCHEMCPLTTGNYLQLQAQLARDGLADRVALVEVTIDPARDTPDRLAAYEKLTGASWTLLTGTQASITAFWKYFGIAYERVPEPSPASIDWYTHQPETYDVVHQDGLFFLGPDGHWRIALVASPDFQGTLPSPLAALLDAQGEQNLTHPVVPLSWTVRQALDNVSVLLGRPIKD